MQVCPSHAIKNQPASAVAPSWLASSASMLRRLTIPRCSHQLVEQSSHLSLGRHLRAFRRQRYIKTGDREQLLAIFVRLFDVVFVQASPLADFLYFEDSPVSVLHRGSDDKEPVVSQIRSANAKGRGRRAGIHQRERSETSELTNQSNSVPRFTLYALRFVCQVEATPRASVSW